jgi:hypothetical protein
MDLDTRTEIMKRDAAAVAQQQALVQTMTERELLAIELKAVGATWVMIAKHLKLKTGAAAYKFTLAALAKRASQVDSTPVSVARALMLERYERLITSFMPNAAMGDEKAGKVVVDALKGQARLLGLDAPRKLDVEHHVGEQPQERQAREERVLEGLAKFNERTIEGETV